MGKQHSYQRRQSGVLLPITSLPGPYGIGDLGQSSYDFIDWLVKAGQRAWQILPLSIPDQTGSPYASLSTAAGNWLLINPDLLRQHRLLPKSWEYPIERWSAVRYRQVFREKWKMIQASFDYFQAHATVAQRRDYSRFLDAERDWIDEYALFQALKDKHHQQPWWTWDEVWRSPRSARRHLDNYLQRHQNLHAYAQWLWSVQWERLHRYAQQRGIRFIGDMPFFIRTDSVNVWANPELFMIDRHGRQDVVAGVPPDAFSRDGQKWGNPVYRWSAHQRQGFQWWIKRFRLLHRRVDTIRFDHFRGLVHTWHVPYKADTARRGNWVPSPGHALLRAVKRSVPHLDLIAEDLGPEGVGADDLRRAFHAPTIRILQFGWNGWPNNPHTLSAVGGDVVYYTANHDTDTTNGWWRHEAKWYERKHVRDALGQVHDPARQSITAAEASKAGVVIVPIQDVLSLGSSARLNRPGRRRGNWAWRLSRRAFTLRQAQWLRRVTEQGGR